MLNNMLVRELLEPANAGVGDLRTGGAGAGGRDPLAEPARIVLHVVAAPACGHSADRHRRQPR